MGDTATCIGQQLFRRVSEDSGRLPGGTFAAQWPEQRSPASRRTIRGLRRQGRGRDVVCAAWHAPAAKSSRANLKPKQNKNGRHGIIFLLPIPLPDADLLCSSRQSTTRCWHRMTPERCWKGWKGTLGSCATQRGLCAYNPYLELRAAVLHGEKMPCKPRWKLSPPVDWPEWTTISAQREWQARLNSCRWCREHFA